MHFPLVSKILPLALCIVMTQFATNIRGDFETIVGWDDQLFPSYLIATAAVKDNPSDASEEILGDQSGLLGICVVASKDKQAIKVTVRCDEFLEPSEFTGILPLKGEAYSVMPKIRYRFDRLGKCKQATPASITFEVQIGKSAPTSVNKTVTFRPISDCPLAVGDEEEVVDLSFTFAAFVNEQHPFVDKLLREALDLGIVDRFTGYQSRDPSEVIRQVYALWDLMVARDVRYSSITTTSADSDAIASQNVRLLEDSINNTQANCVDGSVLFVSMLRKIGIEAKLVLVPGHCYVAFAVDASGNLLFGLETTMIDTEVETPDELPELFENAVDESLRRDSSWGSFIGAVDYATTQLEETADNFTDEDDMDYQLIDIAAARKNGVLPIPFTSNEEFVSFDYEAYIEYNSNP